MSSASQRDKLPQMIRRIVKIQSFYRGHMVRKRLAKIREMLEASDFVNGHFDDMIKEENLLHNPTVKEVYSRMGPF